MSSILEINDLYVTFATDGDDVRAVDGISLNVQPGEILAVVGESGSGKTVTGKTILRMLPHSADAEGAVLLARKDVLTASHGEVRRMRGREAAMVFQEPSTSLNPVYTVGWQIAEGLRAHGAVSKKDARARAIEMLGKVGIPDPETRVDYYPHQFSGGQKQRVVIAAALALEPELIIADEPTTALDVTVQAEILDLLRLVRDEFGRAIVLITHNMGVVADLADRVAVMYRGKIVEQAPVNQLFANPEHEYTKALLAAVPRLGAHTPDWKPGPASAALDRRAQKRASGVGTDGAGEAAVSAENLEVVYPGRLRQPGFRAVDRVTFTIAPGEILGLVGESGSGKTTIGRAIAGLTHATGGSLKVLGHEMVPFRERTFRPLRSRIGFVFQDPATSFNPLLTIGQGIAEPLLIHNRSMPAKAIDDRVTELLEAVHLPTTYRDRFPHELSGGQRQRVSLARALALDPELVIADEPTSALDVSVQAKVLEVFSELQERLGFASLFITHDLAVVSMLADRIAVMHRGKIVEQGTGDQVLNDPQDPYTQQLIASAPVPDPVEQRRRRQDREVTR